MNQPPRRGLLDMPMPGASQMQGRMPPTLPPGGFQPPGMFQPPRHVDETGYLPRPLPPAVNMPMRPRPHVDETGYLPRQVPQGGFQPPMPWMNGGNTGNW